MHTVGRDGGDPGMRLRARTLERSEIRAVGGLTGPQFGVLAARRCVRRPDRRRGRPCALSFPGRVLVAAMLWRTNLGAASWQPCSGSRRHRSTASPSTPHPMSPPPSVAPIHQPGCEPASAYRGDPSPTTPVRGPNGRIVWGRIYARHRKRRARAEHTIAELECWLVFRDLRHRGHRIDQTIQAVSALHNLKLDHPA